MNKDRRKSENTALRELVDALKTVISARDDLWSLGIIDRLFRLDKYKKVLSNYDDAMSSVRNAIQAVMAAGKNDAEPASLPMATASEDSRPSITMEEFEFLLGRPGDSRKNGKD